MVPPVMDKNLKIFVVGGVIMLPPTISKSLQISNKLLRIGTNFYKFVTNCTYSSFNNNVTTIRVLLLVTYNGNLINFGKVSNFLICINKLVVLSSCC